MHLFHGSLVLLRLDLLLELLILLKERVILCLKDVDFLSTFVKFLTMSSS